MYNPSYFKVPDNEKVIAFMQQNPFAAVTGFDGQYPVATHLPLNIEVDENGVVMLSGHLMKNTDHHKAFLKNKNVLVVFNGPHCYVSASWYGNPQTASTWNYMAAHAKGIITFLDDAGTYKAIKNITDKYEGDATAAAFNTMSDAYVQKMLQAITGFTIEVASMGHVFKLSQNKTGEERQNIIKQLRLTKDAHSIMVADAMEKL